MRRQRIWRMPAPRLGRALRGPRLRRQRPRPDRPGGRRREDDGEIGRETATSCSALPTGRRRPTSRAGLPACSGGSRRGYFQRYGDAARGMARIAAKNHRNGVANPYAQLRKDLGFAFCNTVSDKNPTWRRRWPDRLLADLGRRRRPRGRGCRDRRGAGAGDRLPRRAHVNDILPLSRRIRPNSRVRGSPGRRRGRRPGSAMTTCPSSRRTIASPSPNSSSTRRWVWPSRARATGRARGPDREGRPPAGQSLRRPEGQGHPVGATVSRCT